MIGIIDHPQPQAVAGPRRDEALSHAHTLASAQSAGANAVQLLEAVVAALEV